MTLLLQQLNWLSANEMLQFLDSVMAYKSANNLAPEYLCIKLKKKEDHLFMIAQLATSISFISLYIRLLAVNVRLPIEQFLYGTLYTKIYNPPPQSRPLNVLCKPGC